VCLHQKENHCDLHGAAASRRVGLLNKPRAQLSLAWPFAVNFLLRPPVLQKSFQLCARPCTMHTFLVCVVTHEVPWPSARRGASGATVRRPLFFGVSSELSLPVLTAEGADGVRRWASGGGCAYTVKFQSIVRVRHSGVCRAQTCAHELGRAEEGRPHPLQRAEGRHLARVF
jgi:hypothetical protein